MCFCHKKKSEQRLGPDPARIIMGQGQTRPVAPPNEQHLWIQEPINPCFTGKSAGDAWDAQAMMSPAARAAGVRDMAWQALLQEVTDHCRSFRKEKWAFSLLFGAIVASQVISFSLQATKSNAASSPIVPLLPVIFAVVAIVNLLSLAGHNQKVDAKIAEAVRGVELGPGVTATYRTEYTGTCKPKHVNTSRYIAIAWQGQAPMVAPVYQGQVLQGQVLQGQVYQAQPVQAQAMPQTVSMQMAPLVAKEQV